MPARVSAVVVLGARLAGTLACPHHHKDSMNNIYVHKVLENALGRRYAFSGLPSMKANALVCVQVITLPSRCA